MCGIVGYVGDQGAQGVLLDGLARLEYRGYDSAGLAVLGPTGIARARSVGKIEKLRQAVHERPLGGATGVGHTRWATHGVPSEENAHPHVDCAEKIALVHNGIIENHRALREKLSAGGHAFRSQTDSEVLVHLVEEHYEGDLAQAVRQAVAQAEGAFAVAVVHVDHPDELVGARRGSPLVAGTLPQAGLLASDAPALMAHTRELCFLEDGEIIRLQPGKAELWDAQGRKREPDFSTVPWDPLTAERQGYRHFMEKEIYEQPQAVAATLRDQLWSLAELGIEEAALSELDQVVLLACGTSYHACLVAEYLWEPLLGVPVRAEIASEFRYRQPALGPHSLVVAVSQSGETLDTLMAFREAKARGARSLAVANVVGSALTREAEGVVYTRAGLEIGVAASKTFITQLAALSLLGLQLARRRGRLTDEQLTEKLDELARAPGLVSEALSASERTEDLASVYHGSKDALYLARGILYPMAMEGALKLKEISYIHAESYAAGEMKHGPIALIDEEMPVVFLVSGSELLEKSMGNMEEVCARRGSLIIFTDVDDRRLRGLTEHVVVLPEAPRALVPLVFAVPLQLLAYHIARLRGTDVDQPRNLAKTVTVE